MGALSSFSNALNAIILQSPYMACCRIVDRGQCILNMLGLGQLTTQWTMFFIIFVLFVVYFPEPEKYDEDGTMTGEWRMTLLGAIIVMGYMTIAGLSAMLVVAIWGTQDSGGIAERSAALLGTISLVLSICQFVPQLRRTYQMKMAGALSVSAMSLQAPGSFVFCYTLAVSPGTNVTTWMTYFVGGILQSILLVLCIYYDRTSMQHNYSRISAELESDQGSVDSN
jgi:hypothetical protein